MRGFLHGRMPKSVPKQAGFPRFDPLRVSELRVHTAISLKSNTALIEIRAVLNM